MFVQRYLALIVTKIEVDGTVDKDLSYNTKSEVSLINDLQVLAWYFKKESTYPEIHLMPDCTGPSGGNFLKQLSILRSLQKIGIREGLKYFDMRYEVICFQVDNFVF